MSLSSRALTPVALATACGSALLVPHATRRDWLILMGAAVVIAGVLAPAAYRLTLLVLALPFTDYLQQSLHATFGSLSPYRLLMLVVIAGGVLDRLGGEPSGALSRGERERARRRYRVLVSAGLLAALVLLSALTNSHDPKTAEGVGIDAVLLPALLLVSTPWRAARSQTGWGWFGVATTVVLVAETVIGGIEYATHHGILEVTSNNLSTARVAYSASNEVVGLRANGTFVAPEPFATVTGLLAIVSGGYQLSRSRARLGYGAFGLGAVAIFTSGMRGILVPYVAIVVVLHVIRTDHHGARLAGSGVVVAGIVAAGLMTGFGGLGHSGFVNDRLHNTDSVYSRVAAYESAVQMTYAHPVRGVGFGNYTAAAPAYPNEVHGVEAVPYPHDSLLAYAAEGGLPAAALFLWWTLATVRLTRSLPSASRSVMTAGAVFVLASTVTVNTAYYGVVTAALLTSVAAWRCCAGENAAVVSGRGAALRRLDVELSGGLPA